MGMPLPGTGAQGWGAKAGTTCSSEVTSSAKRSLPVLNLHTVGVGPAHSASLTLSPVSLGLLVHILSYRASVCLVFRWFSMMVTL